MGPEKAVTGRKLLGDNETKPCGGATRPFVYRRGEIRSDLDESTTRYLQSLLINSRKKLPSKCATNTATRRNIKIDEKSGVEGFFTCSEFPSPLSTLHGRRRDVSRLREREPFGHCRLFRNLTVNTKPRPSCLSPPRDALVRDFLRVDPVQVRYM